MSIDPATVLAFIQVARVAHNAVEAMLKDEMTPEEIDQAWEEIRGKAISAREGWEASKR